MGKRTVLDIRKERGLTLVDLMVKSGLSWGTVSRVNLMKGPFSRSPMTKRKMAKALGLKPEDILWTKEEVNSQLAMPSSDTEARLRWLEEAVQDCGANIREIIKHVIVLESKAGIKGFVFDIQRADGVERVVGSR